MQVGSWSVNLRPGAPLLAFFIAGWLLIFFLPSFKIIQRTGHSGWWSLLVFVPPAAVAGLWVLAYRRWPALDP